VSAYLIRGGLAGVKDRGGPTDKAKMGRRRVAAAFLTFLLVTATGCGGGEEGFSDREVEASRLVGAQAGEAVTCRDNGAVNTEIHPEYPVGYSCYNEDGEFYAAVVSPDGVLTSLSGPVLLKPAKS
jgi:hypothetical protein